MGVASFDHVEIHHMGEGVRALPRAGQPPGRSLRRHPGKGASGADGVASLSRLPSCCDSRSSARGLAHSFFEATGATHDYPCNLLPSAFRKSIHAVHRPGLFLSWWSLVCSVGYFGVEFTSRPPVPDGSSRPMAGAGHRPGLRRQNVWQVDGRQRSARRGLGLRRGLVGDWLLRGRMINRWSQEEHGQPDRRRGRRRIEGQARRGLAQTHDPATSDLLVRPCGPAVRRSAILPRLFSDAPEAAALRRPCDSGRQRRRRSRREK